MTTKIKTRTNKCRSCKRRFKVESSGGNPYKLCPACRIAKYEELLKYCKRYIINNER
jgi:hypothetical protein